MVMSGDIFAVLFRYSYSSSGNLMIKGGISRQN